MSAIAYGFATAVQHDTAHASTAESGRSDLAGLLGLLRDPRWLVSMAGDGLGLVLQVIALATGPVVLVAPLLVLAVPVALPVMWALGGPRPRRSDYAACALGMGGLGGFLAIVGSPGRGTPLPGTDALLAGLIAAAVAGLTLVAMSGRGPVGRACSYGTLAGACFGLADVTINATAVQWEDHGWAGLGRASGYVPIVVTLMIGAIAIVATQLAFQAGPLAASFPANECAAPVAAVALGAAMLHEPLPVTAATALAYLACLCAVVAATAWLATGTLRGGAASADSQPSSMYVKFRQR
jgi:hypothetical protein